MYPTSSEVLCPVCQSTCEGPPLYEYTSEAAAAHFCPVTRNSSRNLRLRNSIEQLWDSDRCYVYRCGKCGFGFGYPFRGGDEEFYNILHEQRGYPSWRWDYDAALTHALSRYDGGKILDIGAGVGNFLIRLPSEWKRFAVESTALNRSDLNCAGVQVFGDLSDALASERGTFQVVTLFQVLEHISDFNQTIQSCHDLLAPGGSLVITVPDCDAMIRQERLTGCPDMPPNHIGKWTRASLTLALTRAGFEVIECVVEPSSWHNLRGSLHMRIMTDATKPNTIAAQAYRIQNKPIRILALAGLGIPALIRLLPHIKQLRLGGAFGMVAIAR